MTDRPILFSAEMIRALLDGRKTQTRRDLKLKGYPGFHVFGKSDTRGHDWHFRRKDGIWEDFRHADLMKLLPVQTGDRLWARETWQAHSWASDCVTIRYRAEAQTKGFTDQIEQIPYRHGDKNAFNFVACKGPNYWRPSIHMPRWASRLTLYVTDVRVERLQDISEADAIAEGGEWLHSGYHDDDDVYRNYSGGPDFGGYRAASSSFHSLWNSVNGPDAWDQNPWVAAYTFDVHQHNIDRETA